MIRSTLRLLTILFGVVSAARADIPPSTQPSAPLAASIQLFNGKDLSHWSWVSRADAATQPSTIDAVWSVSNGILHDNGKPTGYIRTDAQYHNFILIVEQRHLTKGNGGVLFAITGPDKVWPHCLEAQGQTEQEGDLRGIADFKLTLDPTRTEPKRERALGPNSEKPMGQWETLRIQVDHGSLILTVNGILQNGATQTQDLTGHIGLQAEGAEMEFRKIELTPIGAQ